MAMGNVIRLVDSVGMTTISTPQEWATPLADFSAWMRAANSPATTIYIRTYHLRRFATRSGLAPFAVTLDDLVEYLSGHEWAENTRRSHRNSLRAFYKWAHITTRLTTNPAQHLPRVASPVGKPRPAPEAAILAALAAAEPRVRLMVKLGAQAGLRCCEIAVIHTRDLFHDLTGWSLTVHGKGNKKRDVPLTDELARILTAAPTGYLFPGQINGHLSPAHVSKMISRALPEGVTAHQLRHRFATRAYAGSGGDIRAVQELLGHSSVATTQIYTAIPDDALRRAVASLGHLATAA